MPNDRPHAVPLPVKSCIEGVFRDPDLADAYSIELPPGTTSDPERLARFIFAHQPRWVSVLMDVRDSCVSVLGLKTGRSLRSLPAQRERIGIFKLYETRPLEVLIGEDDKHLDFRASVLYQAAEGPAGRASVVLSTVVSCHNVVAARTSGSSRRFIAASSSPFCGRLPRSGGRARALRVEPR